MLRVGHILLLVVGAILFVSGCNSDSSGAACTFDADCPAGETCIGNVCGQPQFCSSDASCPAGSYCDSGTCTGTSSCVTFEECDEGFDCINGYCLPIQQNTGAYSCTADPDCPEGEICDLTTGFCREKPADDGDDTSNEIPCQDSRDCPNGYRCEMNVCIPLAGTDGDTVDGDTADGDTGDGDAEDGDVQDGDATDGDIPVGNLCEPCQSDPDCGDGNFCMEDLTGSEFCARVCNDANPCPETYACKDIFGGSGQVIGSQCMPESGYCTGGGNTDGDGGGLGLCDACVNDSDCGGVFDKCLPDPNGGSFCGTDCAHDSPCNEANTYCMRISETVKQCYPVSGSCNEFTPPTDGDYDDPTPDGDWNPPLGCMTADDCASGEICDFMSGQCIFVLCSPCISAMDCGSFFDAECVAGGCATDCGTFGSPCPSGYTCEGNFWEGEWCVPVSGSCSGDTDGDVSDGDVSDGDISDGDAQDCSGPCYGDYYACDGDSLCVCDQGQYTLLDCAYICTDAGYDNYEECSFDDADLYHDVCWCSYDTTDGDVSDGDVTDGDVTDGDTGDGTCDVPFIIPSLPYVITEDTTGAPDNLDAYFCEEDGWGMGGGNGTEHVYALPVSEGDVIRFSVTSDFDAVLSVRMPCSENPDICLGADDFGSYSSSEEEIIITMNVDSVAYVTVDGYGFSDYGAYTLTVEYY